MKKVYLKEEDTLDLWINEGGHEGQILITYGGYNPKEVGYNVWDLNTTTNIEKTMDAMLGNLGRDIENWHTYDIVIHWGVHKWKFINDLNVRERDEF